MSISFLAHNMWWFMILDEVTLCFCSMASKVAPPSTSRSIIYCDCSDQIRSHLKLADYFSRQLLPHTLECDFYITYPLCWVTTQQLNEMQDIAQQAAFPRNSKYSILMVKGHFHCNLLYFSCWKCWVRWSNTVESRPGYSVWDNVTKFPFRPNLRGIHKSSKYSNCCPRSFFKNSSD